MNLNASTSFEHQESCVLFIGKNNTFQINLDATLLEECNRFALDDDNKYLHLPFQGKHFFFIKEENDLEKVRVTAHKVRQQLPQKSKNLYIHANKETALAFAEGFLLSSYQFLKYRKEASKEKYALDTIDFYADFVQTELHELQTIIEVVYWSRDLVNEPVSGLNATQLAQAIAQKGEENDFHVEIFEKAKIESLKMGGLLAVNKGSIDQPTFTIAEYKSPKAVNKKPIVLVGKGVVYDTGGLSLKPTAGSMDSMKSDMAGAACMAGTIYAIAKLKLPLHVIALIPATDNRPGLNAYAPGDIITMFDGTTVEVLNTDAEGRMILADALAYSNKYNPELVIDAATLTGAAVRAIGTKASIIMGNAPDSYFQKLEKSGFETYERVVRFPFWDDYFEEMKSKIADLNNLGSGFAGMITAGKFLEHFVKAPYIHMDIAGPAFLEKPQDYRGLGGTGTGVRLLVNFLKQLC